MRNYGLMSCCLVLGLTLTASGAEFAWVPTGATGDHTIDGGTITLQGGGQVVTLELYLWDWGSAAGNPSLGTYQATVDSSGYSSGTGDPLTPVGWPDSPADGAFINTTHTDPDYVFLGLVSIPAVATASLDYEFGAVILSGSKVDDGQTYYCGSLLLDVPVGAAGIYTIDFVDEATKTFLRDGGANPIFPINLHPALISIAVTCVTDEDCNDDNPCTIDECISEVCQYSNAPAGTTCRAAVGDCDEEETCTGNSPVCPDDEMVPAGTECRPAVNACDTAELCDGVNPDCPADAFEPPGTPCGDPSDTDCTDPDGCDGAGTCLPNDEPPGTACGNPEDNECTDPDTCDGAGTCQANDAPPGTPCGDGSDTQCTDPDTCNGAGFCLDNHEPDGTACDDELWCTVDDECATGVCVGVDRDCSDGLDCTTDFCDEDADACMNELDPGYCLIDDGGGGVCYGAGERNPANDCEECNPAAGTDLWSYSAAGTPCDDQNSCTENDECDGAGNCVGDLVPGCNDQCVIALEVTEGSTTSNNDDSGADDDEASCQPDSNHDVWFVYTASCTGEVYLSTTGTMLTPSNDPVLSVYAECYDTEIACDDDSGVDLQAALWFTATAGEDYYIRVAGFEQNTGDIVINVDTVNDCVIDTICYAEGEVNPANDCEMCIPELSTDGWSLAPEGLPCGNPTPVDPDCDDPDACDGAGYCEPNHKPDGTLCMDDGNECRFDLCAAGLCAHPPKPEGTACGDPTPSDPECDYPDTCDGLGDCQSNNEEYGVPCGDPYEDQCDLHDVCDGAGACDVNYEPNGTPCDDGDVCTGDDVCEEGACGGTPIPTQPLVTREGPRAIKVIPQPVGSAAPVALHLTSPTWDCLDRYIDVDGTLTWVPVAQLPDDWDTVIVTGEEIIPSSTYEVVAECGIYTTPAGAAETCLWGDVDCNDVVNFTDIQIMVLAFKLDWSPGVSFEAIDIWPCTPNRVINFADIQHAVLAFKESRTYEDTGCPVPCLGP